METALTAFAVFIPISLLVSLILKIYLHYTK